jgi:pimeloyl-ACP methyl ester carboxylesterase
LELIITVLKIGAAVVVGVPLVIYLMQDGLLFFPQPLEPGRREMLARRAPLVEEVRITAADGTQLHGWLAKPRTAGSAEGGPRFPVVIYFGGNAEEVSWQLEAVVDPARPREWGWLLVNYRGYGFSAGRPSESALVSDALQTYDFIAGRPDVDPARIVAFGGSLGSGVAVQLAAARPLAGIILISPYDSMVSVGQHHYPILPVSLLLRHRFDSIGRAPGLELPLLCLAAEHDHVVPSAHASRLVEAWKGPKRMRVLPGTGHNDISGHPDYWREISAFLADRAR